MRRLLLILTAVVAGVFASSHITPAYAQAARTWVSGVGNDSNDCSRTAPCASFAGALAKTNPGGEINCLDPGGFGAVTITTAISIICDNVEAGVLVSGTNGITINAGPNDVVNLSGLDIEGTGTGLIGISYVSGKGLHVRYCLIRAFTGAGIQFAPSSGTNRLEVVDSIVDNNGGTGVLIRPTASGTAQAVITMTRVTNNGADGVIANGTAAGGGSVSIVAKDTTVSQNAVSGFVAYSNGAKADILVHGGVAFRNNYGIAANGTGAIVRFANTVVTENTTGVLQVGTGSIVSYGNNSVNGNNTDGTFGTVGLQ